MKIIDIRFTQSLFGSRGMILEVQVAYTKNYDLGGSGYYEGSKVTEWRRATREQADEIARSMAHTLSAAPGEAGA